MEERNELAERLLNFSIRVIKFLRTLSNAAEYKVIKYQLIKSSTSSGANYDEAQGASSKADFHNKIRISLKEMRESNYWLLVIDGVLEDSKIDVEELNYLTSESIELKNILGKIAFKTRKEK
jgi:four helix bundle protein